MQEDYYIIALDQGTSSCRAILLDADGSQVSMTQQEFTQIYPHAGWVEHDPLEIYHVQMKVLDELVDSSGIDITKIKAIGITNQRETTVVWDRQSGNPVYNAIVWQDKRTIDLCKKLKASGLEQYTKENMGLPIDPYFSGTKLKWILDNTQSENDLLFGTIDTWLIWKMTNGLSHITDYTNASRTLLFNIKSKKWDDHILSTLNIPPTILPKVQASASHFGTFNYRNHHIPITGVAGDQQAALFGQGCIDVGMAKNTYGTGCFILMNVGKDYVESQNGLLTTLCCDLKGQPSYALEGSVFMAGAAVQWLRDGIKIISDSSETESLSESVKDEHNVIVVPAFAGIGAPFWSMESNGAIYGLTRDTTTAHLSKATLNAIAYRTRDIIDAMEKDSNKKLSILRVDGGASKNNYLMQFQSDILNSEIFRPQNVETTALGAAYLAAIGAELWTENELISNIKKDRSFNPVMGQELRDKLYTQWHKAIKNTINYHESNE